MKKDLSTLLVLMTSILTVLILALLFFMGVVQLDLLYFQFKERLPTFEPTILLFLFRG